MNNQLDDALLLVAVGDWLLLFISSRKEITLIVGKKNTFNFYKQSIHTWKYHSRQMENRNSHKFHIIICTITAFCDAWFCEASYNIIFLSWVYTYIRKQAGVINFVRNVGYPIQRPTSQYICGNC